MEALFLRLLRMSLSASWLVLAVLVLRFLLRKAPKWVRCVLWALVAVRLVCPVIPQSRLSVVPDAPEIRLDGWVGGINAGALRTGPEAGATPAVTDPGAPTLAEDPDHVDTNTEASGVPAPSPAANAWLPALWLAGVGAMLLHALASWLRLRRQVAASLPLRENILLCDEIDSPFILGVARPRIYLPSALTEPRLSHVIAHENAHLARRDHWWKPLGYLLLAVYWFDPLLWLAYVLLCRDIELACDERVVRGMGQSERADYSQALLDCSRSRRVIAACPLAFGEVGVKERVKTVLNYKKPAFRIVAGAVIVCAAVAVCFLTDPQNEGQDLSFLNYRNAVSLIGQNGTQYLIYCPPGGEEGADIQIGAAKDTELIRYLEAADWKQHRAPSENPASPGSVEFVIEEDYRITVYQKPRLARVRFGEETRYYKTRAQDYEKAYELIDRDAAETVRYDTVPASNALIVEFDADALGHAELDALGKKYGFQAVQSFGRGDLFSAHFTKPLTVKTMNEAIDALSKEAHILSVAPGMIFTTLWDKEASGDTSPAITMYGERYHALDLPVEELPKDYVYAGYLTEEQAGDTGLAGSIWYADKRLDSVPDFYVYQECPTVITLPNGEPAMDTTRLQWAFLRWTKEGASSAQTLDEAIGTAILRHNAGQSLSGDYRCESHVVLGSTDGDGAATVYLMALYVEFGYSGAAFRQVSGSHIPVALTFRAGDDGYELTEYWEPRDGSYYWPDLRAKFPASISNEDLDTQKWILPSMQDCYAQAIAYGGVDTDYVIGQLFDEIASSPAEASFAYAYIDAHALDVRELTWYGQYTLRYIFGQFLAGGQTGLHGQLMRIVMDQLIGDEALDLDEAARRGVSYSTGQDYFAAWLEAARNAERESEPVSFQANRPAAALALRMSGYID